jgi:type IV pilus assembly protein PilB
MDAAQPPPPTPLLGDLLLKAGLITKVQLQEALHLQATRKYHTPLGQVFVELHLLTRKQLDSVLDSSRKRSSLGQVLLKAGVLDQPQLDQALQYHKTHKVRLGQAVLRLNLITEDNLKEALAAHLNIDFLNLDAIDLDPRVDKWIKKVYAQKNRVCPISQAGQELTVAMDDPTNVAVIHEIEISTAQKLKIATAPEAMIMRALKRVYEKTDLPTAQADPPAAKESSELVIDEKFRFTQKGKAEDYKAMGTDPNDERLPL